MSDLVLSITVLAAFVLMAGSLYLWRKQGASRQALLMAILSFVMLANVLIWTIPAGPAGGEIAEGGADTASGTASGN